MTARQWDGAPWIAVIVYQGWAAFWIYDALTCSGILCDLGAVGALLPGSMAFVLIYRVLNDWLVLGGGPDFRNWFVIAGTVVTNALVVYFAVALVRRWKRA